MVIRYPHQVWFVNLAPLSSGDGVVCAIADTFKLSGLGVVDPKQALQNYLREKALLLVLDNFEQVLDAAELVADMLSGAPGVQVLITSSERLRLRASRVGHRSSDGWSERMGHYAAHGPHKHRDVAPLHS